LSSKIYPNWDFGFENKPSGNPDPLERNGTEKPIEQSLSPQRIHLIALASCFSFITCPGQGDPIGRIFAQWAIVYYAF
jgi:hypothetical protein